MKPRALVLAAVTAVAACGGHADHDASSSDDTSDASSTDDIPVYLDVRFSDAELAEVARQSVRASAAPEDTRAKLLSGIDDWLAG